MRFLLLVLITLFASNCGSPSGSDFGWKLVYKNDREGEAKYGNKEDLINAVRQGLPVRIGFGGRRANDTTGRSIEHLVDVHFLSILDGDEVFGQILPIIGQRPDRGNDSLAIYFRENMEWTVIVGTNGFSDRLSTDRFADTIIGHRSRPMNASWFVNYPKKENKEEIVEPLW